MLTIVTYLLEVSAECRFCHLANYGVLLIVAKHATAQGDEHEVSERKDESGPSNRVSSDS